MDVHSPETIFPEALGAEPDRMVFRLAAQTWLALQALGVAPTPRYFELWYTYLGGNNIKLTRHMEALLVNGVRPPLAALDAAYAEFIATASDRNAELLEDGAETMQEITRETADSIAAGQQSLAEYGTVLSAVGVKLEQQQSFDTLVSTISMLVAETTRMTDINRTLESRLSNSAAQITKLRQAMSDLKQDSTTDALTSLVNRRGFDSRLRRALSRAKTQNEPLSLLLADVDRFKKFNDTYGHKTGDLVLRLVARILADNVKGKDTAARYGGEEFAIILTGADEYAAGRVAEQIRAALDGKRLVTRGNGHNLYGVTVSIGVAELKAGEGSVNLIQRADTALYRAKNTGRNKVVLSSMIESPAVV